jgi:hypothetical protein
MLQGISLEKSDLPHTQTDAANLRTLVIMLKKTKVLRIDRLNICWPILRVLINNPQEFPDLVGFHIEYNPQYHDLVCTVANVYGPRLHTISLVEGIAKV